MGNFCRTFKRKSTSDNQSHMKFHYKIKILNTSLYLQNFANLELMCNLANDPFVSHCRLESPPWMNSFAPIQNFGMIVNSLTKVKNFCSLDGNQFRFTMWKEWEKYFLHLGSEQEGFLECSLYSILSFESRSSKGTCL